MSLGGLPGGGDTSSLTWVRSEKAGAPGEKVQTRWGSGRCALGWSLVLRDQAAAPGRGDWGRRWVRRPPQPWMGLDLGVWMCERAAGVEAACLVGRGSAATPACSYLVSQGPMSRGTGEAQAGARGHTRERRALACESFPDTFLVASLLCPQRPAEPPEVPCSGLPGVPPRAPLRERVTCLRAFSSCSRLRGGRGRSFSPSPAPGPGPARFRTADAGRVFVSL